MSYREPLTTLRDMTRLYDIRDILHLSGRKKVIVCPLPQHKHQHHTPSFSIFTTDGVQKWRCHGSCGEYGDALDLMGFMFISGYDKKNGDHVKQALALLTGGVKINPPKPETTKQPTLPNGLYRQYLPARDAVLEYAAKRFLTSETLERFHIGQYHSGTAMWMTMPTLHGNQLRGIKLRNVAATGKKDRYGQVPGSVDGLFNYNGVRDRIEPVLIVKGEIAVMVLSQFGILACAPTGGETSYYKHEELLVPLAFSKKRIVVADNDMRPEVREKIMAGTQRRAEIFRAKVFLPPDPYVGIDDFVLDKPEAAIPLIHSWMTL